jgi:hypothetical protein
LIPILFSKVLLLTQIIVILGKETELGNISSKNKGGPIDFGHVVEPSQIDPKSELWAFKVNDENTSDPRFKINKILTSKYTRYTFIPKNLLEQFSKMANIYFLFILVL